MLRVLARRFSSAILVLLGASLITFVLARVIPSDPALAYIGPKATEADAAKLQITLGLDRPLPIQYFHYMRSMLSGDWGYSLSSKQPVLQEIADRVFCMHIGKSCAAHFLRLHNSFVLGCAFIQVN